MQQRFCLEVELRLVSTNFERSVGAIKTLVWGAVRFKEDISGYT